MSRKKLITIIIVSIIFLSSSLIFYNYYYRHTLQLSEIVGKTDNSLLNFGITLFDFDTGLTRHDINKIKGSKDYWLKRMQDVESISDTYLKSIEYEKLLTEMMDDPTMNKICNILATKGLDFSIGFIKSIIN